MSAFHPLRTLARRLNERPFTGARQPSANVCYGRILLKKSDGGSGGRLSRKSRKTTSSNISGLAWRRTPKVHSESSEYAVDGLFQQYRRLAVGALMSDLGRKRTFGQCRLWVNCGRELGTKCQYISQTKGFQIECAPGYFSRSLTVLTSEHEAACCHGRTYGVIHDPSCCGTYGRSGLHVLECI